MKKSQVTLFVILGLMVLVIAISSITLLFDYREDSLSNQREVSEGQKELEENIISFTEGCLESVSGEGISHVGMHGGYVYNLSDSVVVNQSRVALYFFLGSDGSPSKEELSQHISLYIEDNIFGCLSEVNNTGFLEQGVESVEYNKEDVDIDVSIVEGLVRINGELPLVIRSENRVRREKDFIVEHPSSLYNMLKVKNIFMNQQVNNPNGLLLSYMSDLAYRYDFSWSVDSYDSTYIVSLEDSEPSIYSGLANFTQVNSDSKDRLPDRLRFAVEVG